MKAPTRSWGELCTYGVPKEEVLRKVTKILERSHEAYSYNVPFFVFWYLISG
jgi:hypothetical protein